MKKINLFIVFFFVYLSFNISANEDFTGRNLFCSDFLWGFEFISTNKVKVIKTDINSKSTVREYYYENDPKLFYVNIYLTPEKRIRDLVYSVYLPTLRVDVWTMTSGGITSREILPKGFCEITNISNISNYIEKLKINY